MYFNFKSEGLPLLEYGRINAIGSVKIPAVVQNGKNGFVVAQRKSCFNTLVS
jgi:hypothetical protein